MKVKDANFLLQAVNFSTEHIAHLARSLPFLETFGTVEPSSAPTRVQKCLEPPTGLASTRVHPGTVRSFIPSALSTALAGRVIFSRLPH